MNRINVAIAGNPNSGKTTLFNLIAGTHYHVGNYPGVTVEKKEALIIYKSVEIKFVDLPGTYSLNTNSLEEIVARDYIITERPDLILQVADATSLERSLYLTTQFLELETPVVLALNMFDMAKKREMIINIDELSTRLKVPVIKTVAKTGEGKTQILDEIVNFSSKKSATTSNKILINYGEDLSPLISELEEEIKNKNIFAMHPSRWAAIKYIEEEPLIFRHPDVKSLSPEIILKSKEIRKHLLDTLNHSPEALITDYKYGHVIGILKAAISYKEDPLDKVFLSEKIDQVLTNKFLGPMIMFLIIYFVYQFIFTFSEYPVALFESFFSFLSNSLDKMIDDGFFKSLIISGIIDGVGGVLGFTPLIFLMFATIAILEDSGYMARVAYMLDRVFKFFGLQGCSVVSFIVSGGIAGGCAVPGIMATRIIRGPKERLLTILTTPFMMCGAKIPVFALLISAFYQGDKGLAMMAITIFTWISALIIAKILSKTLVDGDTSAFIMELPPYHLPTIKGVFIHAWERTWMYIKKAGTVILGISIALWLLMTFPTLDKAKSAIYDNQLDALKTVSGEDNFLLALSETEEVSQDITTLREKISGIEGMRSKESLKNSIAGRVGTMLEPFTQYAGFDWKTNIALIGGFAAKEVVVSTLGTAYSLGEVDPENSDSLSLRLQNDPNWNRGTAIALIIFTILYAPCFVAVVAMVRETGKKRWGVFSMVGYTLIAYVAAVIAYQICS